MKKKQCQSFIKNHPVLAVLHACHAVLGPVLRRRYGFMRFSIERGVAPKRNRNANRNHHNHGRDRNRSLDPNHNRDPHRSPNILIAIRIPSVIVILILIRI